MTIGSHRIGSAHLGQYAVNGLLPSHVPFARVPAPGHPDLFIDSPHLVFWDVVATDGAIVRVVDYADPALQATPGKVRFDGNDYDPMKIGQPRVSESSDGSFPAITMEVEDPLRVVLGFMRAHDKLRGAVVTMRIIKLNQIQTPSLARSRTFTVLESASLEGTSRVSLTFGPPNPEGHAFPSIAIERTICPNNWERRHVHDGRNLCSYPSDDFQSQTRQRFGNALSNVETKLLHGWRVLNGSRLAAESGEFDTISSLNRVLHMTSQFNGSNAWDDEKREAPYVYKVLLDDPNGARGSVSIVSALDVEMKIAEIPQAFQLGSAGLLVQSTTRPSDWVFWGVEEFSTGAYRQLARVTSNGSSADTTHTGEVDSYRLLRLGNAWQFYSRNVGRERFPASPPAWDLKQTTTFAMPGDIRVGIVLFDNSGTDDVPLQTRVYHIRYAAGGYARCNRSLAHCEERENTIQRNAFEEAPEGVINF